MSDFATWLERAKAAEAQIANAVQTYQNLEPEIAQVVQAAPQLVELFQGLVSHLASVPK